MTDRAWTADDGEIHCEWAQRTFYGGPVIAKRIEELIGRISLFTTGGSSLLRLWDPTHQTLDVRALLAGLSLPERFVVARSPASRTPVETGYLECMRLVAAKDGITAEAAITGFVGEQVERYPDLERHLVELYGTLGSERADDPRFRSIDYPGFDLGPIALGIGLFADHVPYRSSAIWCWSRVVNWHK